MGDLDVRQAELNLARTEALLPSLQEGLAVAIHRLSVLSGELPSALDSILREELPIPSAPDDVVIDLPANLLRQRPDIRQAERELAASTARIGVVTADLYPRFSLTGTFTVDSTSVTDLFEWNSRAFGIGPTMRWNVFSGGRVRAAIEGEEAATEEALGFYEQVVLEGYEEVENALVAYTRELDRRDALERSVIAAREAVRLVNVVYRQGLTEFQNVLDTEQLLFRSRGRSGDEPGHCGPEPDPDLQVPGRRMVSVKCLLLCLALLLAPLASTATEIREPIPPPATEASWLQQSGDVLLGRPVAATRLIFGIAFFPVTLPVAALLGDAGWAVDVCITDPWDALVRPISWP